MPYIGLAPGKYAKSEKALLEKAEELEKEFVEWEIYFSFRDYGKKEVPEILRLIRRIQANIKQKCFTSSDVKSDNIFP
jgi:biotin synthase-like enzyme